MSNTVLIIGASRGLGLGLARQFSEEGWQVIATVRDPHRAEALGSIPGIRIEALELTDPISVDALAAALQGVTLDVLFVNAGINARPDLTVANAQPDEVSQLMFTNAVAPVRLAERLLPLLDTQRGVITFMTSAMGSLETGPGTGLPLYGASKAALNHLTRTFVGALGQDTGLTVVSMHPGWVKTDMGGDQAPLDVKTSCRGMVAQVTQAAGRRDHRFIDYSGKTLPW